MKKVYRVESYETRLVWFEKDVLAESEEEAKKSAYEGEHALSEDGWKKTFETEGNVLETKIIKGGAK